MNRRALLAAAAFAPTVARAQLFNPGAPTLAERDGLIAPSSTWTPSDLGASLQAWWDAEQASTITQAAGLVSAWRDVKAALNVTATGTAQPTYNATGFNGRPVLTFDGVANSLANPGGFPAGIPTGAATGEAWAAVDQAALPADALVRPIFAYGAATATTRSATRLVTGGVNRANAKGGNGSGTFASAVSTVDFSGRHVVRSIFTATDATGEVDGTAGTPAAGVNATATTRFKIGSDQNAAPATFFQGGINALIFTALLDATQASQMYAWLGARL